MLRRLDGALNGMSVTPSDSPLPATTRALMVATPGDVEVLFFGSDEVPGSRVVLPALQPGVIYPVQCERIYPDATTASGIIALW